MLIGHFSTSVQDKNGNFTEKYIKRISLGTWSIQKSDHHCCCSCHIIIDPHRNQTKTYQDFKSHSSYQYAQIS